MSDMILSDKATGLQVDSYAGPVTGDGSTRIRYQITRPIAHDFEANGAESFMTLSYPEMRALTAWIIANWEEFTEQPRSDLPFTFVLAPVYDMV